MRITRLIHLRRIKPSYSEKNKLLKQFKVTVAVISLAERKVRHFEAFPSKWVADVHNHGREPPSRSHQSTTL